MKNRGFTLAEIMIVLTVIGVLTGVLLPIAINSTPDENIMKFKKAHSTLGKVITELVNSDKYFENGLFIKKADGSQINNSGYFCNAFADMLSTKKLTATMKPPPIM